MKFVHFILKLYIICFISPLFAKNIPEKTPEEVKIRIGFFPNITHVHALVAQALKNEGKDWFATYLPNNCKIEWYRFNAGPTAMESLVIHTIDLSYVGPSPALNTYLRSKGKEIRLLSGAIRGGSGLVVQKTLKQLPLNNWENKKIASPQYGNTQDIACRIWAQNLKEKYGIQITTLPTSNPDQLMLFKKKQIDGAWTIEPWRSRLLSEGEGVSFFDDKDNWTTILVTSNNFYANHSNLIESIIKAHQKLTQWIKNNLQETARLIQEELKRQIAVSFEQEIILQALKNLQFDITPKMKEFEKLVDDTLSTSLIKKDLIISLDRLFEAIIKMENVSHKNEK